MNDLDRAARRAAEDVSRARAIQNKAMREHESVCAVLKDGVASAKRTAEMKQSAQAFNLALDEYRDAVIGGPSF